MRRNKKINKQKIIIKLAIFFISLGTLITLWFNIIARYESNSSSTAKIETAFYVLNEDFQSMSISLNEMIPRSEPYIYNFSVSNYENTTRAETTLEYDLEIITTTNLPITYELYLNQNYTDSNSTSAIKESIIEKDKDGTYFNTIKTEKNVFEHSENRINVYQIVIYFPATYKSIKYQNIFETIKIKIDSKQII